MGQHNSSLYVRGKMLSFESLLMCYAMVPNENEC